jgi:outer membrane protein assembly factor BamA
MSDAVRDSLRINYFKYYSRNFRLDQRPDTTNYFVPLIKGYKPKFRIDSFWGGVAYSSSYGTIGMLQLGLSDLMGDHGIGLNMEFNGALKESNLVFSYMYLPYRVDYGVAAYNFSDNVLYPAIDNDRYRYFEHREYETGGYFLVRYPLSRFFRLDFEQQVYKYRTECLEWDAYTGDYLDILAEDEFMMYVPQFGYVFDNALYGSTGPMTGMKLTSFVRHSFSPENKRQFTTFYNDLRTYNLLSHRFSFANRLIVGSSRGDSPERFNLYGFSGVRGFTDYTLRGRQKVLTTLELRYPFIDYLRMPFPLPMAIGNIRGSLFADIGAVWNDNKDFRGRENGRLNDVKFGFGFGPRANLGFLILKLDIAWQSDFMRTSKPSYFITINEDF